MNRNKIYLTFCSRAVIWDGEPAALPTAGKLLSLWARLPVRLPARSQRLSAVPVCQQWVQKHIHKLMRTVLRANHSKILPSLCLRKCQRPATQANTDSRNNDLRHESTSQICTILPMTEMIQNLFLMWIQVSVGGQSDVWPSWCSWDCKLLLRITHIS